MDELESNYGSATDNRVILLFDMDAFEVQVHDPDYSGTRPRVVINSSGRILAVSYEAKQIGISRDKTPFLEDAKRKFQNLRIIQVPSRPLGRFRRLPARPDTSIVRDAGVLVRNAILLAVQEHGDLVTFEYSSPDECYLDVTKLVDKELENLQYQMSIPELWKNTILYDQEYDEFYSTVPSKEHASNQLNHLLYKFRTPFFYYSSANEKQSLRLLIGSHFGCKIIKKILNLTRYQSSVGVGSNKLVSKLASGAHKPGSITIYAPSGFEWFSHQIKVADIPTLGGKIGEAIQKRFNLRSMHDLRQVSCQNLANTRIGNGRCLGNGQAAAFLRKADGLCNEGVTSIMCPTTSGVIWNLRGNEYSIKDLEDIIWDLTEEIMEKMEFEEESNNRSPSKMKLAVLSCRNGENIHSTIEIYDQNWWHEVDTRRIVRTFINRCDPSYEEWDEYMELDEIKITAFF